jgi:hypothetical protein
MIVMAGTSPVMANRCATAPVILKSGGDGIFDRVGAGRADHGEADAERAGGDGSCVGQMAKLYDEKIK